ncbi:MAG: amidase [Bacteroidales bacterium]
MKEIKIITLFCSIALLFIACNTRNGKDDAGGFPASYLEEMTITNLQKGYTDGTYTVKSVVEAYLSRIEAIDNKGPAINSVLTINPDAIAIAEQLDMLGAEERSKLPLFGVPVLIKDNIATKDKMPNTAGSRALANSYSSRDSQVAAKLREAGAVIIGKTNLSEWANFRSGNSSSGWSGLGGQTKNPYVLDRNPCGSSSGSGVAVAANLCMFAIGTETNGSIVCPSNNNGIVGIKPTVGLISRSGIIPISYSQDTPGPMARTVEDAVRALGILTGNDPEDGKTAAAVGKSLADYTMYLKADGLKGKRIGVMKDLMGYSARVDSLVSGELQLMKSMGAELIEVKTPSDRFEGPGYDVLLFEFKDGINKYLQSAYNSSPVKSLEDLIRFNSSDSLELRYFDQKIFEASQLKEGLDSKEYKDAIAMITRATREYGIDKLLRENNLDALVAPTGSPAWKTDLLLGDHFVGGSSSLAAIAGYPSITVPAGFIENLPVSISFFGTAWSEPLLIEISYSYEQASTRRKRPLFLITD